MKAAAIRCVALAALCGSPVMPAWAQASRPHLDIEAGLVWTGGAAMGSGGADLTKNQSPPVPYPIFRAATELGATLGVQARVGYLITPTFAVEGTFQFARPQLRTRITGDVENAPAVTASETITQYAIDVSAVVHVRAWRLGRAVPFVAGGAGYLRELHEGDVLVETGQRYHAGGGLICMLGVRPRGRLKAVGLRLDGRVYFRTGGVDIDAAKPVRAQPAVSGGLLLRF